MLWLLWAGLTNKREKNFVLNKPNGLIVPSGLQWNKMIERKDIMEFIARKDFHGKSFLKQPRSRPGTCL